MGYKLEPEGKLIPVYQEDPTIPVKKQTTTSRTPITRAEFEILLQQPRSNSADESWKPEPGITSEESVYCGPKSRYHAELDGLAYEVVIRRTLPQGTKKDMLYKAIIVQNGRAIGELNYLGIYTGKKKTSLEVIIDIATPSNRKTDPELAKLANSARKILKYHLEY